MSRFDPRTQDDIARLERAVIATNERAERLAQRLLAARKALLMGGQSADIRCRTALAVLDGEVPS